MLESAHTEYCQNSGLTPMGFSNTGTEKQVGFMENERESTACCILLHTLRTPSDGSWAGSSKKKSPKNPL